VDREGDSEDQEQRNDLPENSLGFHIRNSNKTGFCFQTSEAKQAMA